MQTNQASQSSIDGRALRRARNVVRKWEKEMEKAWMDHDWQIRKAINEKRYERACALIVADKLARS